MAMNLHKGDNVNRLHSKVIDTIPYNYYLRNINRGYKLMMWLLGETSILYCPKKGNNGKSSGDHSSTLSSMTV